MPHTLVLAPGLVIDKVYVGYWFWGRPSAYQLWADLGDLFRRIKPDFDPTAEAAHAAWEASQGSATPAPNGHHRARRARAAAPAL